MKTELLLGDEAIGLAAIHAGIGGAFSYPGTPATEILEFISKRTAGDDSVSAMWSANEKVAYEEALGMSYAGKRAIVSMKHVGLNVAADPFVNSALTGVNGGLVCVVADDPSMHSSQNEQDSRYLGEFAKIPVFEPSTQQEAYDFMLEAFEVSEKMKLPVLLRIVTRLAHSRAVVKTLDESKQIKQHELPSKNDWTLIPANARRRFRRLLEMQPKLVEYSDTTSLNTLHLAGKRGIITAGLGYNYVREALAGDTSDTLLKIGTYPLPVGKIRDLVNHCEEILIIEEGYPFIESHLNGLLGLPGKNVRGKLEGSLSLDGELTPDSVAKAIGKENVVPIQAAEGLPGRPPALCKGCPHIDTFNAMLDATKGNEGAILFSDIGCYTLGCLPPFEAVHSCVDMGASIAMGHGASQAGRGPVLCTIGDSTFTHSGMTGLIGAARANANMTVFLLDNATVAMTGGQGTMAAGDDLINIIKGLGVDQEHMHIIEPLAKHHQTNVDIIAKEIKHPGLSVIVSRRACIQIKKPAKPKAAEKEPAAAAGK